MFGQCCHCQDSEERKNQINYDPPADPGFTPGGPTGGDEPPVDSHYQKVPPPGSAQEEQPPPSGRSQSSLTPEEKAAEKARLQELVKKFAKSAVQGVPCELVLESGMTRGKYKIDKKLQKMTMESEAQGTANYTFMVSSIQEIHRMEDGEVHFPPNARQTLGPDERARALAISYTNDAGQPGTVCFLENGATDKERFLTCMKILRLYSQTATPKSG